MHSKLKSETPHRVRGSLETGTFEIATSKETDLPIKSKPREKNATFHDKKKAVSSDNFMIATLQDTADTKNTSKVMMTNQVKMSETFKELTESLNYKMSVLLKDLNK